MGGGKINPQIMNISKKGVVCFIKENTKVLLGLIEYPSGEKKWNGIGGYVGENESPEDAAVREIQEETHIVVEKNHLRKMAELNVKPNLTLIVFVTDTWRGEIKIKDPTIKELRWFSMDDIPYEEMFAGNNHWLPNVLED